MPERTIQKIITYRYPYCFLNVDRETWINYSLSGSEGESIRCLVSQLIDKDGNILCIVNQNWDFKTELSASPYGNNYRIYLPREFISEYNIKSDMYIDLLMTDVIRDSKSFPISPKRLSISQMEIMPKDEKGVSIPSIGLLISTEFTDEYYSNLVIEINKTYGYGLYTATLILLRKLFENLIIDLLSARYGMKRIELFYDKNRGYHHNISTLINNLKENISDFNMFTRGFDEDFFNFLDNLREKAGGSAHSIDIIANPKLYDTWKDSISKYSRLLLYTTQKVKDMNKVNT